MSNDLISRSAVLDILFHDGEWACDISVVYERVSSLPTAYDPDKVAERIEKKALKMSTAKPPHTYMRAIGTHEAIKIVKSGGVKE